MSVLKTTLIVAIFAALLMAHAMANGEGRKPRNRCAFTPRTLAGVDYKETEKEFDSWRDAFEHCKECYDLRLADVSARAARAARRSNETDKLFIGSFAGGRLARLVLDQSTGRISPVVQDVDCPLRALCGERTTAPSCPDKCDFDKVEYCDEKYKISNGTFKSWKKANEECKKCFGTRLATIDEYVIRKTEGDLELWIGSADDDVELEKNLVWNQKKKKAKVEDDECELRALCDYPKELPYCDEGKDDENGKDDECGKPGGCGKDDENGKDDECGKPGGCGKDDEDGKDDECGKPGGCGKDDEDGKDDECGKPGGCGNDEEGGPDDEGGSDDENGECKGKNCGPAPYPPGSPPPSGSQPNPPGYGGKGPGGKGPDGKDTTTEPPHPSGASTPIAVASTCLVALAAAALF